MMARDVVQAAALLAARHAYAPLPASLVLWSDESQSQGEGDLPRVTLSTVSLVPEGPVSLRRSPNAAGDLVQRMLQTFIWTVQCKCEGWKLDSAAGNNPILFAHRMRFGWYLQAVTSALLDPSSPEGERTPVKMVDEVGLVSTLNQRVRGHTLPVNVFEVEFRYVDRSNDPTPIAVLDTLALGGSLDGNPLTLESSPLP
jgi:hypothetical protein